jgi:hypothetical protein
MPVLVPKVGTDAPLNSPGEKTAVNRVVRGPCDRGMSVLTENMDFAWFGRQISHLAMMLPAG